jgi:hypothetical protein
MGIEQQAQNALEYLAQGDVQGALSVYENISSNQRRFQGIGDKPFADIDVCIAACRYFIACQSGAIDAITTADGELRSAINRCLEAAKYGNQGNLRIGFIDASSLVYIAGLISHGCKIPLKFFQLKHPASTQHRERPSLAFLMRDYVLCCLEVYIRAEDLPEKSKTQLYKALADLDNFGVMYEKNCGHSPYVAINGRYLDCDIKMKEIYNELKRSNPRIKVLLWIAIPIILYIAHIVLVFFGVTYF